MKLEIVIKLTKKLSPKQIEAIKTLNQLEMILFLAEAREEAIEVLEIDLIEQDIESTVTAELI